MDHASLGARIRHSRDELGLSLSEVARRAHIDKGYLSQLETGKRDNPSEAMLQAIGDVLGVDLVTYTTRSAYPEGAGRDVALVFEAQPDGSVIIVQMDRRAFLATATAAAAATAAPVALPDRITPEVVGALSDRLDWHVASSRVTPGDAVARQLRTDLAQITTAARTAPAQIRPGLLSLGARYAEHLGWMRQDAGDDTSALYWTDRAADYAHAAGWRQMVAHTYTRKSFILLDSEPDHAADLARVARARQWNTSPTFAARAAAHEAEARATAGDARATQTALDAAQAMADRADPDDHVPAPQMVSAETLLHIMTARSWLALGRPEEALDVLAPLAREWTTPRSMALYGSSLALAHAQVGDVNAACRIAHEVARDGQRSASALARRRLRTIGDALAPWAGRDDVDQVLAALPA